jgi:hypothetical protein
MDIGLAVERHADLDRISGAIWRIDGRLRQFFHGRDYGMSELNVYIGLILTGPGSERLHPVRPVKYRKRMRHTSIITGEHAELENVVTFDVKPSYENLKKLNSEEAEQLIAVSIVEGAAQLEKLRHELPNDFIERFRSDLAACLSSSVVSGSSGDPGLADRA